MQIGTRSAPWNPASTRSASSLSSRHSCATGKAVNASRRSERNLPVVDLRHLIRPMLSCEFRFCFTRRVCFQVLGSQGFGFSWTLVFRIFSLESGLQFLSPLCSIGGGYTTLTPSTFHCVSLLHASPHRFGILSTGESLSLMPLTLIAPRVGFVFCCIYSTATVHFFLIPSARTLLLFFVDPLPLISPSRRLSLIQCFVIVHRLPLNHCFYYYR